MNKDNLIKEIEEGLSTRNIADKHNISQSTVRYWLTKYYLKTCPHKKIKGMRQGMRQRTSKVWVPDVVTLTRFVKESDSLKKILLKLGLPAVGGNYNSLKKRMKEDGIDFSHIVLGTGHGKNKHYNRILKNSEIFTVNSELSRSTVRRRILIDKLISYECAKCGNKGEWHGIKLTLHLEHKNGVRNDNRLENLEFLCPNCHSQTDTYAGKNNK